MSVIPKRVIKKWWDLCGTHMSFSLHSSSSSLPISPSSLSLLLSPGATTNGGREKGRRMEEIQLALEATVRPIRANVFRAHARMALAADSVHRWQRRH